jgi:uncharacterized protein
VSAFVLALFLATAPAHAGKHKEAAPAPAPAPPPPEAAEPAIDPAFEADIRKLLEVTGSAALGAQMRDQMFASMRQNMPNVPSAYWDEVANEFDVNELIELTVPIYAKHLTHEDVRQLLQFYESPIGQKAIRVMPALMQEAMLAGEVWGQEAARRAVQRLQERSR